MPAFAFTLCQRIQWIMYLDMCAIKVVRNAVLEHGTVCPSATIQDCCGQYKCPINCLTSEWSGWAKCTAECEEALEYAELSFLHCKLHAHVSLKGRDAVVLPLKNVCISLLLLICEGFQQICPVMFSRSETQDCCCVLLPLTNVCISLLFLICESSSIAQS